MRVSTYFCILPQRARPEFYTTRPFSRPLLLFIKTLIIVHNIPTYYYVHQAYRYNIILCMYTCGKNAARGVLVYMRVYPRIRVHGAMTKNRCSKIRI